MSFSWINKFVSFIAMNSLNLETTRSTLTTSTFKLAALGTNIGLLVLVRTETKVLDGFTSVLGTTDENGVGTSGGTESQLIQGQTFTTCLQDTSLGSLGEVKGSNRKLGEFKKTGIVSDGTNDNNSLVILSITDNAGNSDRRTVDARHKETLQDDLVEFGICTAGKKTIKLL